MRLRGSKPRNFVPVVGSETSHQGSHHRTVSDGSGGQDPRGPHQISWDYHERAAEAGLMRPCERGWHRRPGTTATEVVLPVLLPHRPYRDYRYCYRGSTRTGSTTTKVPVPVLFTSEAPSDASIKGKACSWTGRAVDIEQRWRLTSANIQPAATSLKPLRTHSKKICLSPSRLRPRKARELRSIYSPLLPL
jgi:hypothetical protein